MCFENNIKLLSVETSVELFNASACIDKLLLTCVERVACWADFHEDVFLCRTCFDWDNLNEDLIAFYQKLGKIRNEYKEIFKDGDFEEIICKDGLIIYKRIKENKSIFVYSNNSSKRYPLKIKKVKELISGEIFQDLLEIKPQSYGIFVEEKA